MENLTDITFILDRSGSMSGMKKDAEGGFNQFVRDQVAVPGECRVSLVQFDHVVETVFTGTLVKDVGPLELVPRGSTALLDAIGTTIVSRGQVFAAQSPDARPSKVLFVIITDGQENASKEYTHDKVAEMVAHQKEKYGWEFVFLGADLNAAATARSMNIGQGLHYSIRGMGTAYANVSSSVARMRSGGSIAFTPEELAAQAAANK